MTIKIKDKEYPVLADWATVESFCLKKGIDLDEWNDFVVSIGKIKKGQTLQSFSDIVLFIMCCLERGAEDTDAKLELKRNDVYNWFMNGNQSVIGELISTAYGNLVGDDSKNPEAPKEGQ